MDSEKTEETRPPVIPAKLVLDSIGERESMFLLLLIIDY